MDMEIIRRAIAQSFLQFLQPEDLIEDLLPPFTLWDLVDCIIMELIKPAFTKSLRTASPRARLMEQLPAQQQSKDPNHYVTNSFDNARMVLVRKIAYAENYRKLQHKAIKSERGTAPAELLPPKLQTMPEKLAGRKLNDMQYDEIMNLQDIRILKKINSGELASSKNISNSMFSELFTEYSEHITQLGLTAVDDETLVYNTFARYHLMWNYPLELYYQIICAAESVSDPALLPAAWMLSMKFPIYTSAGRCYTENRFVLHRGKLVPLAVSAATNKEVKAKIKRYLIIKCKALELYTVEGRTISDFVEKESNVHDWAEFIRQHYPLLQEPADFQWTSSRIHTFRKFLREVLQNSAIQSKYNKLQPDKEMS